MQDRHVPAIGGAFWLVFVVASIFGAIMGDVAARHLGLARLDFLPVLMLALVAVLVAERLDNVSASTAWYWMAIAVIPMVATNLGDFAVARGYSRAWLMGGLVVLQVFAYFGGRSESEQMLATRLMIRPGAGRPLTDAAYWIALLIASTLGPVLSDVFAYRFHLGALDSAAILLAAVGAVYVTGRLAGRGGPIVYWPTVILVRAAGNALGDVLSTDPRVGLGLLGSAVVSGGALVVLVATGTDRKADSRPDRGPDRRPDGKRARGTSPPG